MTSLLISEREKCLTLNLIDESMRLFGIDCTMYDLDTTNMYLDNRVLKNGVPYKILMQDYVDLRLLANLKWSTTDADSTAMMAFMPIQYLGKHYNLREFNIVELCNGDIYQIREVNRTYLIGTWYIVKLITYQPEEDRPRETRQMQTNYIHPFREELE